MTIDKVKEILADHLDIDVEEITDATTFEDLGVDSLDTVEIMMEMEDEFGVEISTDEHITSVAELVKFIDEKKAN